MWKHFPDRLCGSTGFAGIVYDRRGFGQSSEQEHPRTVNYLHKDGLVELVELLKSLIPGKPYWLVGQSDGASIALIHASERPPLLKGVVAEAPHVMVEPVTVEGIRKTVGNYDGRLREALAAYHGKKAQAVFDAWHEIWLDPTFRHWNIEYLLPSIVCPCLILQGKDDPYATDEHARLIASRILGPTRLELIPHCGHAPHTDAAEDVLRLMTDFITGRKAG
jgi:pimeloyl-ACP methyl ester carboxylesterase